MMLAPVLTPHGLLMLAQSLEAEGEAPALEPERGLRLEKAFARGAGHGLVLLGADEVGTTLSPTLSYWRRLGARYMTALCALPGIGERNKPPVPIPADGELDAMAAAVPPMIGCGFALHGDDRLTRTSVVTYSARRRRRRLRGGQRAS